MRVTAAQVYRSQLLHLRRRRTESARAQEVAASGVRLLAPSDDPVGAARSVRVRAMRGDVETARDNIESVGRELGRSETALGSMGDVLSRARELAVAMSNPVASAGDRGAVAQEVVQLRQSLIDLGNSRIGDRRLFGGSQTGTNPFDASGTYTGDASTVAVGLYASATVQVTLDGGAVLAGTSGGPNVLESLDKLATALTADDIDGVRGELDTLDRGIDWLSQQRSLVGARMKLLDNLDNHLGTLEVQLVDQQSELEDADVVEAYSELVRTKTAFESVLQVTAAARGADIFQLLGI